MQYKPLRNLPNNFIKDKLTKPAKIILKGIFALWQAMARTGKNKPSAIYTMLPKIPHTLFLKRFICYKTNARMLPQKTGMK